MHGTITPQTVDTVRNAARPLTGRSEDWDPLLDAIGDRRSLVLIGEASHGTQEFYHARAEITKRLIHEKGFTVVAWEADWPDALRVHRYVRGRSPDRTADEALSGFQRFPIWMWRNMVVRDFVQWLRQRNETRPQDTPEAGIYGLDLYSLHRSIESVIRYLEQIDRNAAQEARNRYACFEPFGEDPSFYGYLAGSGRSLSCEEEVVTQLLELHRRAADFLSRDGQIAAEELFYAQQNARVAKNAEAYYRALYRGRPNTWNLRDTHMVDTLERLLEHLRATPGSTPPKAVVWAHNSHLGDARATQMGRRGELNVGQLIRQRHPGKAFLIGFTTDRGTVIASSEWDEPAHRKHVRPSLEDSYERLFHETGVPDFLLMLRNGAASELATRLSEPLLERAIGVIYRPETERWSHYFEAQLARQFDAVIHYDVTHALKPLPGTHAFAPETDADLPETFPSGE